MPETTPRSPPRPPSRRRRMLAVLAVLEVLLIGGWVAAVRLRARVAGVGSAPLPRYELEAVGLFGRARRAPRVVAVRDGVEVTFGAGGRSPTTLTVAATPAAVPPDGPQRLTSECGLRIRYAVERSDGGSGGAEAVVRGTLRTGERRLAFTCHAQSEYGDPEGACLEALGALCAR